ncbi:MAG: HD domain-containing protein [Gammaproteobacteria bacterium]|nr:MAG: HD domain-containing protein [Gammaproteobacteria bacterium]
MNNQDTEFKIESEQEELEKFYEKFRNRSDMLQAFLTHLANKPNDVALRAKIYQGIVTTKIQSEKYGLSFLSVLMGLMQRVWKRTKNKELRIDAGFIELTLMVLDESLVVSKEVACNRLVAIKVIERIRLALLPLITCAQIEQAEKQQQGVALLLGDFSQVNETEDIDLVDHEENTMILGANSDRESDIDLFDEKFEQKEKMTAEHSIEEGFDDAKYEEEELFLEDRDMALFRTIADTVEFRNPIWRERDNSIMSIALGMNGVAKNPVCFEQLEAAVYMRDFGMLRMPDKLFYREEGLSEEEQNHLHSHPVLGYEILSRLGGWDEAAAIVLQHQEREDGSGYPEGLTGEWICSGAKIIAICDTFFQLINNYEDLDSERASVRAVAEINSSKGVLYDSEWVDIFNKVMKIQNRVHAPQI